MPHRQSKRAQSRLASRRAAGARRRRPPSRAEKLARARELVRDPDYPSPQVIQAVARTLAQQWTRTQTTGKAAPSSKPHRQA